jgi:hypothetical protein
MNADEAPAVPDDVQRGGAAAAPASGAAGVPRVLRAPHIGVEFDRMIALTTGAIAASQNLHRVAHYTSGVYDFAVDVLDDPAVATIGAGEAVAGRRSEYMRAGQQLAFITGREDLALSDLRSGKLIRTVLHSSKGAIFCTLVRRGEHLTGLSLAQSRAGIDDADRALSELVTEVRAHIGLGSENPGGWGSLRPAAAPAGERPDEAVSVPDTADDTALVLQGVETDDLLRLFRAAVNPADVHYAAYHQGGHLVSAADCLDDGSIRHLFTQITPAARRRKYGDIGASFPVLARRFGQLMTAAVSGRLLRAVLDVEQGAIYYYRLADNAYLIGVTLQQAEVKSADDRMAALADAFRGLHGGDRPTA